MARYCTYAVIRKLEFLDLEDWKENQFNFLRVVLHSFKRQVRYFKKNRDSLDDNYFKNLNLSFKMLTFYLKRFEGCELWLPNKRSSLKIDLSTLRIVKQETASDGGSSKYKLI